MSGKRSNFTRVQQCQLIRGGVDTTLVRQSIIDFVFRTVVGIRILYAMQTYLVEGTGATTAETGLQHAYTLRYYVTKYLI